MFLNTENSRTTWILFRVSQEHQSSIEAIIFNILRCNSEENNAIRLVMGWIKRTYMQSKFWCKKKMEQSALPQMSSDMYYSQ